MGIASRSLPTCSPSTNSSNSDEPDPTSPPTVARGLSHRLVLRTPRGSVQYPFPHAVEDTLRRTSPQATDVQPYREQLRLTPVTDRRSSLATIRQSMAYLQSFDEPPSLPPSLLPIGYNWVPPLSNLTAVPAQSVATQATAAQASTVPQVVVGQQSTLVFEGGGGLTLASATPVTIQAAVRESPTKEQNPGLSRESSLSAVSSCSIPGSQPRRPSLNRTLSQATISPVSAQALTKPQTPPPVETRAESQTTITPTSFNPSTDHPPSPSHLLSLPTPDEPHLYNARFPHNIHHHHHQHRHVKSSFHNATDSTCSWSTNSQDPDPRYDRLIFDYRVISQSMHAYRQISIFRRFGRLSMANLLYYQDELAGIERALANVDREETRWMQTGVSESEGEKYELRETRVKLMKMLRETLKSYYEALLLQEQIFTSLDPPRPVDSRLLAALEDPSSSPSDSSPFSGAINSDDLVALGLGGRDSLEKLVGRIVPAIFPHRDPSAEDVRHRNLSQRDISSILSPFTRRITRLIIAIATTAMMLGPMVILQFLTNNAWKLVCISLFTISLALLVALATRGRGEAIVMVIAAYAAVLVVFVQGGQVSCASGDVCTGSTGVV